VSSTLLTCVYLSCSITSTSLLIAAIGALNMRKSLFGASKYFAMSAFGTSVFTIGYGFSRSYESAFLR
jgi:hypothetical protein